MRRARIVGWTSLWRVVYILPGYENNERVLRHEPKHLERIERDGRVLVSIKYRYGRRALTADRTELGSGHTRFPRQSRLAVTLSEGISPRPHSEGTHS